jgi:hypothetical protein
MHAALTTLISYLPSSQTCTQLLFHTSKTELKIAHIGRWRAINEDFKEDQRQFG